MALLFQPLIYFAAVIWVACFAAYGVYVLFQRAPVPFTQRIVGLFASILVGGAGAGLMIGGLYLFTELF
ncbi:MAG TPA: hypothetical protein VHU18_13155 [Rhizomicrobium sp.]|jgi:hypothetical protein|nr:hypothetical protein [Rhizomicrobium sp.]